MSKHTPGPWQSVGADEPYADITIKAGHRGIARLWLDDAPVHDFNSEQESNAKLIAAAPDLLSVAKELDIFLSGWCPTECSCADKAKHIHDRLSAAIKKATSCST